jgi:hypothetical protein
MECQPLPVTRLAFRFRRLPVPLSPSHRDGIPTALCSFHAKLHGMILATRGAPASSRVVTFTRNAALTLHHCNIYSILSLVYLLHICKFYSLLRYAYCYMHFMFQLIRYALCLLHNVCHIHTPFYR